MEIKCKRCGGATTKSGVKAYRGQKFQMRRCKECGHYFKGELLKKVKSEKGGI